MQLKIKINNSNKIFFFQRSMAIRHRDEKSLVQLVVHIPLLSLLSTVNHIKEIVSVRETDTV
jgi:hypothetical protein